MAKSWEYWSASEFNKRRTQRAWGALELVVLTGEVLGPGLSVLEMGTNSDSSLQIALYLFRSS